MVLERGVRGRRWVVTPDAVHEPVERGDTVGVEQQKAEHRPAPRAAEGHDALAVAHLQRAQDPELHAPSLVRRR